MSDDTAARIYGIGIGPGDPELITLKAFRLMQAADIIFAPRARVKGESLARSIVEGAGIKDAAFIELDFPMVTEKTELEAKWRAAAADVVFKLNAAGPGTCATFITLGDPGVYSTWSYLQNALAETAPQLPTQTVAGVSTMNAASAALNHPLICGREKLALIPMPADLNEIDDLIKVFDTIVLYKVSNRLQDFCKKIEQLGLLESTSLVKRTGLPEEEIFANLTEVTAETEGYLSTAIIRCGENTKGKK